MGILEDFPTDPFTPSLRYAATCQRPVTLPWGNEFISLGTTLSVSRIPGTKSEFTDKTAFSQASLRRSRMVFTSSSEGSVAESKSVDSAASSEHVDFSITGQVGGSFIGASGRAKYEKHVSNDSSVSELRKAEVCQNSCAFRLTIAKTIKSSLRTTYRSGKVAFVEIPALSEEAVDTLRHSNDPHQAFKDAFGDYYVAAYVLGGSNASMLGGAVSSDSLTKDLSGSYTVKVAFFSKTKAVEDHEIWSKLASSGSLSAYDSLDKWDSNCSANEGLSYASMLRAAEENGHRGWQLASRVDAKASGLGLEPGMDVSWAGCESLCRAGLVVELLLMPYAALREYAAAVVAGV